MTFIDRGNTGHYGLLLLIIVVAVGLRLFGLSDLSLWYDEAVSFTRANETLADVVRITSEGDAHPPGYYVLLHYWFYSLPIRDIKYLLHYFHKTQHAHLMGHGMLHN